MSFAGCRPFQVQSVEHLCSILPDFNWQRARAVPQRQLGFLYRSSYALRGMCLIYNGRSWYNFRELCERKFTTTDRITLIPRVARVTVIDVGVDFVRPTINELAHTALVLCKKLRPCMLHVDSVNVTILLCTLICSIFYTLWTIRFFFC